MMVGVVVVVDGSRVVARKVEKSREIGTRSASFSSSHLLTCPVKMRERLDWMQTE